VFYPAVLLQEVADTLSADAARVGSELRVEVAAGVPTQCRGRDAEIREALELLGAQVLRRAGHSEVVLTVGCAAGDDHRLVLSASSGRPVVRTALSFDSSMIVMPGREARSAAVDLVVGRLIVLSLGGTLTVERRADAPPRYEFTVPIDGAPALAPAAAAVAAAVDAEAGVDASQRLAALAATRAHPVGERRDARGAVLVVDDSATTRALLAQMLARDGLAVEVASTAREALAKAWERPFDVVLLDVELPDGDGIAVLGQLRELGALERLSVLMISAVEDSGVVAACIEQGAEDYLVKPVSPVVLRARIGACFEKKLLRERSKQQLVHLAAESRRAALLLRTLLPDAIADELQATGAIAPRRHERVAVMFIDVVDFTRYCDGHAPEEVLVALQGLFAAIEPLAERHGVMKVKTIGDAVMLAAGLFVDDANPAARCVALGRAALAALARLPTGWAVRIGVHVGPVVSGVAGLRQYRFDIWGDTVNIAQRIEQVGTPGVVCVSAAVRDAVAGRHAVRSRGTAAVKGKGELEIFEVVEDAA
jgi:class 3 adenylate cyclase